MGTSTSYRDVIEAIVDEEHDAVGDLAQRRAESLKEIDFEEDKIVFEEDPGPDTVRDLLDSYREIQGKGSTAMARKAMGDLLDPDFDLDLPPEIIPPKLNQERFVKGF